MLDDTGLQPFTEQTQDALIRDPMLKKP